MQPARVILVGSVNEDLVVRLPHLPSPGETVTGGELTFQHGGKGANQAAAAARLGARTWLVGATGDDDLGRDAREALEAEGIDLTYVSIAAAPTGVASILVDAAGENLIGVASGANAAVRPDDVARAITALAGPDDVVLANLEIPEDAVQAAAETAHARGSQFVLNPAPARLLPLELVARCDALTLHRADAAPAHIPAFLVEPADTTGAGDAFNGALAWALTEGEDIERAVVVEAAAGALATRGLGARATMPNRDELKELLASGR